MALAQPRFQGSLLTVSISLAQYGRAGENPGNEVVSLLVSLIGKNDAFTSLGS